MIARFVPIVGVLLLFPLSVLLDHYTPPPPNVVQTLPPASVLPVLASGHRETFAAFLELKAVGFVLGTMEPGTSFSDENRDHTFLLYQGILTLDPDDVDAAVRGSVLLSAFGWRADSSAQLLRMARGEPYTYKGKRRLQRSANPAHPSYWRLWFEEAGIYLSMRANEVQSPAERDAWIRKAGLAWIEAEERGAPPGFGLRRAGERLTLRGLDRAALLEREQQIWEQRLASSPAEVQPQIAARVKALVSVRMALALDEHPQVRPMAEHVAKRGGRVSDIRKLPLSFPPEALEPPSGGTFEIIGGHVVCPQAEAFLLAQSLTQSLQRLREANPTQFLTLADLNWIVPPYAELLESNPLFRVLGWYPAPPRAPDQRQTGEGPSEEPWWEILPEPVEPATALGLKPVPYLRYWIEGDEVRVEVVPASGPPRPQ